MPRLASRVESVADSLTLKLNAQVQEMQKRGIDVVNLTTGEPDFPVPEAAKEAVRESLILNRSKYTPVPGILPLREAVAKKTNLQQPSLRAALGKEWTASQVIVTNGGKQSIFNTLMAVIEPGDQVLMPAPFWISYVDMAKLVGGVPVTIPTQFKNSFKMTPDELSSALDSSSRAKLLIINSPCNPTGSMYSRAELAALARVLETHPRGKEMWILSDEIYDRITLGVQPFVSFLEAAPSLYERVVTINGMSKAAAMTGWRIGWSVAAPKITEALGAVQAQSTSGINALGQWASVAALALPESSFDEQLRRYRERSQIVFQALSKANRLKVVKPEGAFYYLFGVQEYLKHGETSLQLCERLLRDARVALVPGDPFGAPGYLRLSFSTDEVTLRTGCERLVEALLSP